MGSESPWVVLAERLGYCMAEGIYVRSRLNYAMPIDHEDTQSMLVGEALRVARYRWSQCDIPIAEHERKVFLLYLALGDKTKARLALELLDAVGYPASS